MTATRVAYRLAWTRLSRQLGQPHTPHHHPGRPWLRWMPLCPATGTTGAMTLPPGGGVYTGGRVIGLPRSAGCPRRHCRAPPQVMEGPDHTAVAPAPYRSTVELGALRRGEIRSPRLAETGFTSFARSTAEPLLLVATHRCRFHFPSIRSRCLLPAVNSPHLPLIPRYRWTPSSQVARPHSVHTPHLHLLSGAVRNR